MPRVRQLTDTRRLLDKREQLSRKCKGIIAEHGITKKEIAEMIGITPQAINYQFHEGHVEIETLIAIVTLSDLPAEELKKILKVE